MKNPCSPSLRRFGALAAACTLPLAERLPAQTAITHDPDGNRLSQAAAVAGPPTIVSHPQGRLAKLGGTARFSVVAGGPGPFAYQWFAGATPIAGATSDSLTLSNLQAADFTPNPAGSPRYSCRVTNGTSNVTSNPAALFQDSGGLGLPDWWQLQHFGQLGIIPTADADNDGRTNLDEYLEGTDPNLDSDRFFKLSVASPPGLVRVSPAASAFAPGSTVTLTATSAGELQFAGWSGVVETGNPLSLPMNGDKEVTAVFGALPLDAATPALEPGATVHDFAVRPDGSTIVAGTFDTSPALRTVVRLRPDGTPDPAFVSTIRGAAVRVAWQPDGNILLAGNLTTDFIEFHDVVRLHPDGSIDTSFAGGGLTGLDAHVRAMVLQPDGKVLVGGAFGAASSTPLRRYHADGSLDASFVTTLNGPVSAIARQSDGRILIAGDFSFLNSAPAQTIARLLVDGATDPSFVPGVTGLSGMNYARILVLPDGRIQVGGEFRMNEAPGRGLARFLPNGALDVPFQDQLRDLFASAPFTSVYTIARQGGRIIAGGAIFFPGLPQTNILRLTSDGAFDRSALVTSSVDGAVFALAVQGDGSVLVGGEFFNAGAGSFAQPRASLARLVSTNSLLPGPLGASPAGPVFAANASTTLTLTPQTLGAAIVSVGIESSSDGVDFQPFGSATRGMGGSWTHTVPALPPGVTYYRAVVTDALQQERRSFAAGPFVTPPALLGAHSAAGAVGVPFTYTAQATGPLTGFTATGLPPWATGTYDANLGTFTISGSPTTAGFLTVTLRPANAAGQASVPLSVTIANRFAAWQSSNFTPAELADPALSGPTADATGAGFPNLLRYALGVPAKRPGVAGLPVVSSPSYSGTRYLTLTYTRDRTAADVALSVQVTGNLVPGGAGTGWSSGPSSVTEVSRTDLGNGTETVVTRDNIPLTGAQHRFIRLQATALP